jgi:hypothetical protein
MLQRIVQLILVLVLGTMLGLNSMVYLLRL